MLDIKSSASADYLSRSAGTFGNFSMLFAGKMSVMGATRFSKLNFIFFCFALEQLVLFCIYVVILFCLMQCWILFDMILIANSFFSLFQIHRTSHHGDHTVTVHPSHKVSTLFNQSNMKVITLNCWMGPFWLFLSWKVRFPVEQTMKSSHNPEALISTSCLKSN